MKHPALLLAASLFFSVVCLAQKSDEGVHAPDGGTVEMFMSILLPPVPNAPFTSMVTAEWTKVLEDGSTLTVQNRRLVVRDTAGRIFQERRRLIPKDSQQEPDLLRTEISDPVKHQKYFCRVATKTCTLEDYVGPDVASAQPVGTQEDDYGTLTREDLGKNYVDGVETIGTRETRTLNAGAIGNDHVISIVKEIWYSPKLGINVSVKRVDPRHGTQIITVTEINQGEPSPRYFSLPVGYTVVDHRSKAGERSQVAVGAEHR
jgi:hypothetical protein